MEVLADRIGRREGGGTPGAVTTTAFDVFWEATADGRIALSRDVSAELGYGDGESLRELHVRSLLDLVHPEDAPRVRVAAARAVRGAAFRTEFRVRGASGSCSWWECRSAAAPAGRAAVRWCGAARNVSEARRLADELRRAQAELDGLRQACRGAAAPGDEPDRGDPFSGIVGESRTLRAVLERARAVAPTDASVLITGETGTGKGVVAQAIHLAGRRRAQPFVVVNCGALPASLLESELFGHEKGAFTGAVSTHTGRFELAHRGTIFLDEIAELPPEAQVKLLRVLQTGEFERLGGNTTRRVDVRVIAATNRDLEAEMVRGRFRDDLFYRLNVVPVVMPPLRERVEDIPLLAAYLVERKGRALGRDIRQLPAEVLDRLMAYPWPGNVREMENVIERALILSTGPVLDSAAVVTSVGPAAPQGLVAGILRGSSGAARHGTLQEVERDHILRVCEESGWRIKGPHGAARRLGLNPSTLYFRLDKLGIRRPS